jgi:hypothetical protein
MGVIGKIWMSVIAGRARICGIALNGLYVDYYFSCFNF